MEARTCRQPNITGKSFVKNDDDEPNKVRFPSEGGLGSYAEDEKEGNDI